MKTRLTTFAILLLASAAVWGGDNSIFKGRIISITDQGRGAIIVCEPMPKSLGGFSPTPYSAVFVRGNFSHHLDGDRVKIIGTAAGKYQYTTARGALATVASVNAHYILPLQDPPLANE